jgi:endonuclease/exonuclease/phosphatase family metal-dependent hydrolase
MHVMTFNIRGAYWKRDGENFWPKRAALNVATIAKYAPDLIGFQELQDGNLQVYEQSLTAYRWSLGPAYGNQPPFEYPAIAWRPKILELCDSGGFWLSETPQTHSGSWATDCIRSAHWARFRTHSDKHSFLILNTHLDHVSAAARLKGAELIVAQLQAIAAPEEMIIVTGDFNCDPETPPYRAFTSAGFVDSYRATGGVDGPTSGTFHGFVGDARVAKRGWIERIDWILLRGGKANTCDVVRDAEPPRYPSDHYPVVAEIVELRTQN